MPACDFNKVALQITLRHGCSPVNLRHIFPTAFPKNTSGRLLLYFHKKLHQTRPKHAAVLASSITPFPNN